MRNSFGFLCCGSVILNRDAVGRRRLYLDKVVYPLKGTVELHSHCTPLPPVMEAIVRGYLVCFVVAVLIRFHTISLGNWGQEVEILFVRLLEFSVECGLLS